jgi:glycosyltransferase 2 family protein
MAGKRWFRIARAGFALVVLVSIAWGVAHYWQAYASQPLHVQPRWGVLIASAALTVATYAALAQTLRVMLAEWNERISFWRLAHIWTVANLYRYVPGKVWQIGAMGVMAQREGISPIAATGSAMLSTIVNITTGCAVALATGSVALDAVHPGTSRVAIALTAVALAGLVALPMLMPRLLRVVRRATGRDVPVATVPPRVIAYAIAGNLVSWVLYGLAFQLFVVGVLGHAAGDATRYIAVFSAAYVLGYIVLFLPAGVGARELSMVAALQAFRLVASREEALLIAVASRLWTSMLELVPGFIFLAVDAWRRRSPQAKKSNASSR